MNLKFEWDDRKAAENIRNHRVSFAQAVLAFRDPFAVEWIDLRQADGEERIILLPRYHKCFEAKARFTPSGS